MHKFTALVHGSNFLLSADGSPQKHGFYVSTFVEAATLADAEAATLTLLRAEPELRATLRNLPGDPPRLDFEELHQIEDWPADCARPLSGFAFYLESPDSTNRA